MFRYIFMSVLFIYVTVEASDQMIFTVTNSGSKESSVVKNANRGATHLFKTDEKILVECKQVAEKGYGTLELRFCASRGTDRCHKILKTNESTLKDEATMHYEPTVDTIVCIINNTIASQIILIWQPAPPKVLEIGSETLQALPTSENIVFQGKINDTKTYLCTNSEKVGTIHWEFCRNEDFRSCIPAESSSTKNVYQKIKLTEENIGTIVKCALKNPYNIAKAETMIMLRDTSANWSLWIYIAIGLACACVVIVTVGVVYLKTKGKFRYNPPPQTTY